MSKTLITPRPSKPVFIAWKEHYSVGHDEMDDHHKVIFSMINELFAIIQEDSDVRAVGEILDRLVDYTRWHFAREEELMEIQQFPGLSVHRDAHRRLVKDLDDLRFRNLQPGVVTGKDLLHLLKRWWLNHICNTDKHYSSCFSHGWSEMSTDADLDSV